MATQGAGAALLQSATATAVTNPVALAVANASLTSLVTQASISLVNNKGDLGGVFDDLSSSRAARAFATSVLVAGLTAGITTELGIDFDSMEPGVDEWSEIFLERIRTNLVEAGVGTAVDVTVGGGDFEDSLLDHLAFAAVDTVGAEGARLIGDAHRAGDVEGLTRYLAHAGLGCAIGAVAGEFAADQFREELLDAVAEGELTPDQALEWAERRVDIARLAGALAVAVSGGDEEAVNTAADTAANAARENAFWFIVPIIIALAGGGYATVEGDGDPLEGLARIGRGEDQVSQWLQDGVEWSLEEHPESTLAVLGVLEAMGEGIDATVTWVDDATGNTMSGLWHELDPETQDQVKGAATLLSLALPASSVKLLAGSGAVTYLQKIHATRVGPRLTIGWTRFTPDERHLELSRLFDSDNPHDFLYIGKKRVHINPELSQSAMVFDGVPDSYVKRYFLELTGANRLPDPIEEVGKGRRYTIETTRGNFTLRDFATRSGSDIRWTVEVPGTVFGPNQQNRKIKFF